MANAVLIQNPTSIYDDLPGEAYHFPARYLGILKRCVGDWVILYESRAKGGAFGYVGYQKLQEIVADTERENHYYAVFDAGSLCQFETVVPRARPDGLAYEKSVAGPNGRPQSGGASVAAVRSISFSEFIEIVTAGRVPIEGPDALPRVDTEVEESAGFQEVAVAFEGPVSIEHRNRFLSSRAHRDPAFRRMVVTAYRGRCAISGLELRNGGGRAEVQAAHIKPVEDGGPDIVQNGLALSATVHWMFDRGLISVAEDLTILMSRNKVPADVGARLLAPEQKLYLPDNPRHHPHPAYLKYHRENKFGQLA